MKDATHGHGEAPGPDRTANEPAGGASGMQGPRDRGPEAERGSGGVGDVVRTVVRGFLALVILAAGGFAAFWFNWTEKRAEAGAGQEESARLVETLTVQREDARVVVRAMGTVEAAREVVLSPRVSGRIVEQSESFVPGGHFQEGDFMLQIDRTDYKHTLRQRQSELAQAQATLEIEKGDQAVAREELQLVDQDELSQADRDLILRKPQVNQAEASVKSARAALNAAQLDLERTRLEAPFDGHLVSRSVTVGNNVAQGDQLATLVGSERYWVRVPVPVSHLRYLDIPDGPTTKGSRVRITDDSAWGPNAHREGRVVRLIGELDAQSRRAQVMVRVEDPLARWDESGDKPSLILGAFVDAQLFGRKMEDVVKINRSYIRSGGARGGGGDGGNRSDSGVRDVVWVMNEKNRLEILDVTVAFRGKKKAYVTGGLRDGDRVVKTNLAAPVGGMLLRTQNEDEASGDSGGSEDEGAGNE